MPEHQPLKPTDIAGLILIMTGLCLYRFLHDFLHKYKLQQNKKQSTHELTSSLLFEHTDDDDDVGV